MDRFKACRHRRVVGAVDTARVLSVGSTLDMSPDGKRLALARTVDDTATSSLWRWRKRRDEKVHVRPRG